MNLITTAEAATKLGVHQTRVQVLIRSGRLPAQMIGGTYILNESDLALVANRKVGRPPKPKGEGEPADGATGAAEAVTTAGKPATATEPLTPKVKAKRAKKAAVAAPKEGPITAEKRTTKAKGRK